MHGYMENGWSMNEYFARPLTLKRTLIMVWFIIVRLIIVRLMQMAAAIKMILYAADAKESALAEAQEYIYQSKRTDAEDENEE